MSIQDNSRAPFGVILLIQRVQCYCWYLNECLSFSFRYLVEFKLFQSLKNEATWVYIWVSLWINWICRSMKYGQMSCIQFYSCYQQQCSTIDLFSYWTRGWTQKGPMNYGLSILLPKSFLIMAHWFFLELSMVLGVHVVLCVTKQDFLKVISLPKNWSKNFCVFWIYWTI